MHSSKESNCFFSCEMQVDFEGIFLKRRDIPVILYWSVFSINLQQSGNFLLDEDWRIWSKNSYMAKFRFY